MDYEEKTEAELVEASENDKLEDVILQPKKTKVRSLIFGLVILIVIVAIAIVLIVWNAFGGVKEIAVASVNDYTITQSMFDEFYLQQEAVFKSQGLDVNNPEQVSQAKQQALDTLINQSLLMQAAAEEGVLVTAEQVQGEYDSVYNQFDTDADFQAALVENNLTSEQFRNNILTQLTIQQYLAPHVNQDVTVNDEEVQELYDQYKQQGSNIPSLEEARAQLEGQIQQQKIDSQVSAIIDNLKQSAEIEISEDLF